MKKLKRPAVTKRTPIQKNVERVNTASRWQRFLLPLLLLLTLIVFARVVACDFTNWDDRANIASNPRFNPPTWDALQHHWAHTEMDIYMPMTRTVWAGIATVGRLPQADPDGIWLNPYLFHGVNLLVHLLSVAIVFQLLQLLVPNPTAAFFGAAVFAVHPVMVEPVAWVSGLKDVLCGALSLLALRLWVAPVTPRNSSRNSPRDSPAGGLFAAAAVYALALLSKPSAVALPLVAGALAVIAFRWKISQAVLRLLPWMLLAIPIMVIAKNVQPAMHVPPVPLVDRPRIAIDAIQFYLGKLLWPAHLGIDYGHTPQAVIAGKTGLSVVFAIALLICALLLISNRRRHPLPLAAAAIFVGALVPVLGLVTFDFQWYSTVADHYLYLAMLGPALLVAAVLNQFPRPSAYVLTTIVIAALSVRSFVQTRVWSDQVTLMSHALEVNPQSWVGHFDLGLALMPTSADESIRQLKIASQMEPTFPHGFGALGEEYLIAGKLPEGVSALQTWAKLAPADEHAWSELAAALSKSHDRAGAIAAYRQALKINPNVATTCSDLASELAENRQITEAIDLYTRALQIDPNLPAAKQGLAIAMQHLRPDSKAK